MFAIIKSGGRQYKVSVGEKLEVNRLPVEAGQQVEFGEVLLISDADNSTVGAPFIENAKVVATVDTQARGPKLIIFKYKSKKRYRHRRGHRQELTLLTIDDILTNGKSLITGEAPKAKETPTAPVAETSEAATPKEEAAELKPKESTPRRRRTSKKVTEAESSTEE
ncbi:MAG TPA: 50S ribosomal protein L21 [Ktedonobacteraceae bacterium]|jgi:large subunit ribosomal protein L21|nr:50S ribosomal protein L21 [Ktedonobacteraceae bacterium]